MSTGHETNHISKYGENIRWYRPVIKEDDSHNTAFGLAMEAEEYTQVREKQVKEALSDMEHLGLDDRSTDEPDDPSMDIIDQE